MNLLAVKTGLGFGSIGNLDRMLIKQKMATRIIVIQRKGIQFDYIYSR